MNKLVFSYVYLKDPKAIGQWIYQDSENNRGERKFSKWLNK